MRTEAVAASQPAATAVDHEHAEYWVRARTDLGAKRINMEISIDSLMPDVIKAAATCGSDYCDLGRQVYEMINRRFRAEAAAKVGKPC